MRVPAVALTRHALRLLAMVAALLSFGIVPVDAEPGTTFDHARLARRALEQHIRPGYVRLAAAAAALEAHLASQCPSASAPARAAALPAYEALVDAWGRIEHVTFGPVATDSRRERLLFWPDRGARARRQLTQALEIRDSGVVDAASLARRSVALQDLGALDIVMFASQAEPQDSDAAAHRCGFARAIASNLTALTRELADEWHRPDGHARIWQATGAATAETTLLLARVLDEGFDRVRDQRLVASLGFNRQRRAVPLPLAASGQGVRLLAANLQGLLDLWTTGGLEDALADARPSDAAVGDVRERALRIASSLREARDSFASVARAATRPDADSWRAVAVGAGFPLKVARAEASALMELVAGIPRGFRASDGD